MYFFAWFKCRCKLFWLNLQTNLDLLDGLGGHPAAAEGTASLGLLVGVGAFFLKGTSAAAHASSTAGIGRAII